MQEEISIPYTVLVSPGNISGNITAPASKSSMQRACAAALVRKGMSRILNPGISNDDRASLGVIQNLGAKVARQADGSLLIDSTDAVPKNDVEINFGESGLGIRMFTPIAALNPVAVDIAGQGSLTKRPMDFFDEVLPQLGVEISSKDGLLPLHIKGPLKPADIEIDCSLSSQFLTGLLLAFAAADATEVSIKVNNLKSKPYVDLTLKVMQDFGLKVPVNNHYASFYFEKSQAVHQQAQINYMVEGDWSGGAFLLVAGAIAGPIKITGLDTQSTQADKAVLLALQDCGCQLSIADKEIEIGPGKLKAFHFDANDCPDLFPPLVALAAYCEGTTVIEGVERLTHKESNRALTLQDEFAKLGVEIVLQNNLMLIKGGNGVKGGVTHSRHDHRIAMACAVAALKADAAIAIEEAAAVKKSYPNFYKHLEQLGVSLTTQ
ncbi:3-phosphoshikimate 1-carboxyvinyltransferase [Arachidicoccus sp.]|uniref:3-phosphoshikimate 1-carboxyvinyltransferase n=1 Tax=Arachidicoccus sp. TaxID=1872624 RepID=UPI003D20F25A